MRRFDDKFLELSFYIQYFYYYFQEKILSKEIENFQERADQTREKLEEYLDTMSLSTR